MDRFKKIRAYHTGVLLAITDWITLFPFLAYLKWKTTRSVRLEYAGDKEQIKRDIRHGAIFITNHRDICLDAAFLSVLLRCRYNIRPYIGIGNNLFGKWWIEPLARLNRVFVVIRGGKPHELRENAQLLSDYINHLRARHKSIWIAQREGRAKDSNDLTQPSVLKMFTLGTEDFISQLKALNICPVSISYEYDPCDYLKAAEMQLRRDNPHWHKTKRDDLKSMSTGIWGQKGRVVFRMTPSINPELDAIAAKTSQLHEQAQLVAEVIDRHIHAAYEIFERGEAFDQYIESRIALIDIPNKDENFLREKLYEMYNYPVLNHKKALANNQQ